MLDQQVTEDSKRQSVGWGVVGLLLLSLTVMWYVKMRWIKWVSEQGKDKADSITQEPDSKGTVT